jgi:hypothetical protein
MVPHHVAEPRTVDVRVDLRRADVGVAERFLHDAEVGSATHDMRRERVSQGVRMDFARARDPFEWSAGLREEEPEPVAAVLEAGQVRRLLPTAGFESMKGPRPTAGAAHPRLPWNQARRRDRTSPTRTNAAIAPGAGTKAAPNSPMANPLAPASTEIVMDGSAEPSSV